MRSLISAILILSFNFSFAASMGIKNETATVKTYAQDLVFPNNQSTKQLGLDTRIETGNQNLLVNPSFESATVTTGWISSETGSIVKSSAEPLDGKFSLEYDATSGLNISQVSTINAARLNGLQMMASIYVKSEDPDVNVCAVVNSVDTNCVKAITNNTWKHVQIPFIAGGTNNGIRVKSTGTGLITVIDNAFVGLSSPFQNVNGAKLVGTVTISGCAGYWSTSSTSFVDYAAQTGCTYTTTGQALAPSTNIPAIKFASLPAGDYKIEAEGGFGQINVGRTSYYQFSDGTNSARETSQVWISTSAGTANVGSTGISQSISYSSTQTNPTLSIKSKTDSGGLSVIYGINLQPLTIKVWYFPPESKIYSQKEDWFIDANIGGSNVILSNSSSTYIEATNSSLDLVINSSKGSASAEIACASGTASSGLTCSAVNESVGIAFVPPRVGRYKACFSFSHNNYPSNTFLADTFQVIETSNTSSSILNEGGERITGKVNNSGNQNVAFPYKVCGRFNFTDTNKKTLRLMYESSNAGTINENWIYADRSSTFGQQDIHVSVEIEKAEIIGSFAGIEACSSPYECTDTFSAYVSSTGVVSNENIDWINGSAAWSPTGTATITLNTNLKDGVSGISTGMNCVATSDNGTSSTPLSKISSSTTTSIVVMQITGAGTSFNGGFYIKCQKGTNDYKPKTAKIASSIGVPTVPGVTTSAIDTFSVSYGTTNATTVCSASPCSYLDQIGNAVSSITWTTTGNYVLNTNKTYTKLKCSLNGFITAIGPAGTGSTIANCSNTNACSFVTARTDTAVAANSYGTLYCQGQY